MKTQRFLMFLGISLIVVSCFLFLPHYADAQSAYNSGSYGTCDYNACGITFGADASTDVSVDVAGGVTKCTTARVEAQVATQSSSGYSLTMGDSDTDTAMENGSGGSIPSSAGTNATPRSLTANTWGYRVDGNGGFGSGPSSAAKDTDIPSLTFAGIPSSSSSPDVITYSTVAADPYTSTFIYFGVCADTTQPQGTYSDSVVYTAVVN